MRCGPWIASPFVSNPNLYQRHHRVDSTTSAHMLRACTINGVDFSALSLDSLVIYMFVRLRIRT